MFLVSCLRLKYPHEVKFNGLQDGEKVVDVTCGQDHTWVQQHKTFWREFKSHETFWLFDWLVWWFHFQNGFDVFDRQIGVNNSCLNLFNFTLFSLHSDCFWRTRAEFLRAVGALMDKPVSVSSSISFFFSEKYLSVSFYSYYTSQ